MHRWSETRARLFSYADILELGPHGFARMQLQGDDTFLECQLGVVVGEIHYEPAVEEMLDMIAAGDDDDVVPVVQLEQFLERFRVDECAGDVFLSIFPRGFFTDEAHSASFTSFVVDKAGHIWEVDLVSDFVLVTADHPIVGDVSFGDMAGPVLNAGVVA